LCNVAAAGHFFTAADYEEKLCISKLRIRQDRSFRDQKIKKFSGEGHDPSHTHSFGASILAPSANDLPSNELSESSPAVLASTV
jgi:hypothetical protein